MDLNHLMILFNIVKMTITSKFSLLIYNLKIIINNKKMILFFLLLLPIVFYIVKIQIYVGFVFFIYYIILFYLIKSVLKTEYIISCKELPLNTSRLKIYAFINIFIFVPKAKAFIVSYNILDHFYDVDDNNSNNNRIDKFIYITTTIIILLIIFLIKLSIFLVLGYTFLSLLITSELILKYFSLLRLNYKTKKAKNQTIIINCFLDSMDSVGKADHMNIIISGDEIIFNMKNLTFLSNFAKKVKHFELLQKVFKNNNSNLIEKKFVDGHYNFSIVSKEYRDKNLTKNLTSTDFIKAYKEDNSITKLFCRDTFQKNLIGKNKPNSLTDTYELDENNVIIGELQPDKMIKMQGFGNIAYNSITLDLNQKLIYSSNQIFRVKEGAPLVLDYAKDAKLIIYNDMEALDIFLNIEDNKEFFQTKEGQLELNMAIKILSNLDRSIIFDKTTNKFFF